MSGNKPNKNLYPHGAYIPRGETESKEERSVSDENKSHETEGKAEARDAGLAEVVGVGRGEEYSCVLVCLQRSLVEIREENI